MAIPVPLPPNLPAFDIRVSHVETLRQGAGVALDTGGFANGYREIVDTTETVISSFVDGQPAVVRAGTSLYVAGWLDDEALRDLVRDLCAEVSVETQDLPEGVRRRDTATERFWFNYTDRPQTIDKISLPACAVRREAKA